MDLKVTTEFNGMNEQKDFLLYDLNSSSLPYFGVVRYDDEKFTCDLVDKDKLYLRYQVTFSPKSIGFARNFSMETGTVESLNVPMDNGYGPFSSDEFSWKEREITDKDSPFIIKDGDIELKGALRELVFSDVSLKDGTYTLKMKYPVGDKLSVSLLKQIKGGSTSNLYNVYFDSNGVSLERAVDTETANGYDSLQRIVEPEKTIPAANVGDLVWRLRAPHPGEGYEKFHVKLD